LFDLSDVVNLALGTGPDLDVGGRDVGTFNRRRTILPETTQHAADIVIAELALSINESAKFFKNLQTLPNVVLVPSEPKFVATKNHIDSEEVAHLSQVLIAGPEDGANLIVVGK
jgi:hypothetical protein